MTFYRLVILNICCPTGSPTLSSININHNNNNNDNNSNNNLIEGTKINQSSFQDILTPIQQLKNINNKLNINQKININNSKVNQNEMRPASTPSSSASLFPPTLNQNIEQFSSLLGEEIVNNWRQTSFLDLPPPSTAAPSTLTKLTTSMQNRMINQFPNFTDCLTQNHHHHHHIQMPSQTDVERNENSSTASTPTPNIQECRIGEDHLNSSRGGGNTPSLPPLSKSPSEDNHPLLHNGGVGPLSLGALQFHPFGERGNNSHFKFADDLHLPLGSMVGRLGDSLIPKGDPMEARLQEMLRYNMDKYANQNLDTLHISRRVRELLSVHNIGQRIFAKYVLGLSQGTVSELLSKPKPWDKLTEKGRDSYRKMHAWALDDQAILLLKSLIPKKGKF